MTLPSPPEKNDPRYRVTERWGSDIASAGFTVVPNHLLAMNQFLPKEKQITPTELVVLLQILAVWWSAERWPFPSKATIARRAGLSPRQVQRALNGLEEKELILKITRFNENFARTSNAYELTPLVEVVRTMVKDHPQTFKRQAAVLDEGEK